MTSVDWLQLGLMCCVVGLLGVLGNRFNGDLLRGLYGEHPALRRSKSGKYLWYLVPAYLLLLAGLLSLAAALVLWQR